MIDMTEGDIHPAIAAYTADLSRAIADKKAAAGVACVYETTLLGKLSALCDSIALKADKLADDLMAVRAIADAEEEAYAIRDKLIPAMNELRALVDEAEGKTAKKYWPFPSYADILFSVR